MNDMLKYLSTTAILLTSLWSGAMMVSPGGSGEPASWEQLHSSDSQVRLQTATRLVEDAAKQIEQGATVMTYNTDPALLSGAIRVMLYEQDVDPVERQQAWCVAVHRLDLRTLGEMVRSMLYQHTGEPRAHEAALAWMWAVEKQMAQGAADPAMAAVAYADMDPTLFPEAIRVVLYNQNVELAERQKAARLLISHSELAPELVDIAQRILSGTEQ